MLALAAVGCRETPPVPGADPSRSPNAQPDIVAALREDLVAERHPSDGGGRAWLDPEPGNAVAGGPGTWALVYEAGPHGIAVGGMLLLQVSPFWGWSTPQVDAENAPGYTTVVTESEGVSLDAETLGPQLLGIRVNSRPLASGEQVRIAYGAGPSGARADTYAERESRFWVSVDGDGDGIRGLLPDSPVVEVGPGPPARMALTLPSVVRPGETVSLNLAVLDAVGNARSAVEGVVTLTATGVGARVPPSVRLASGDCGRVVVDVAIAGEETVRIEA